MAHAYSRLGHFWVIKAVVGMDDKIARRFGGVIRLYGEAGFAALQRAHVAVVGVGGVGSWVVEALARSGVGQLTLIDLDHVALSNVNRQLPALSSTLGQAKVQTLQARVQDINPLAQVTLIEDFVSAENVADYLPAGKFSYVVDAIDQMHAKVALLVHCHQQQQAVITVGGAGGRLDPLQVRCADLAQTFGDRLLARLRTQLRRDHGFSRAPKAKFGIPCVFSSEPIIKPTQACDLSQGLNCAGYGASMCVTANFALVASSYVLRQLSQP